MGFTDKQIRSLQRGVPLKRLRVRSINGREFAYIEGWHAISEANRIFGFDGWNRETTETRCALAREQRGTFLAIYTAKVRVTVHSGGTTIVREGHGTGEGRSTSPGEAHEVAIKAAETDATKRALATFGKPFGLALYVNGKAKAHERGAHEPATNGTKPELRRDESPDEASRNAPSPAQAEKIPVRIDKSVLLLGHPRRLRDKDHLRFVGHQPCLICSRTPSDAHHLRFAQQNAIGSKVGDQFTVPLCREHHRQVHQCSDEGAWWSDLEIDAVEIANGLWEESRAKRAALVRSLPGAVDPTGPTR